MSDQGNDPILRAVGDPETARPDPIRRGRNIITVIGIDAYQHWRRLNNAVNDAKGVRDLFVEGLGFQELIAPLYNEDATKEGINELVLDQLKAELKEDDCLVLFFAGHGHTEVTLIGERKVETGYLIPVGGLLPQEKRFGNYLRLDSLLEDVALLPPRHIMVILDACYSGFALGPTVSVLRDQPERYTDELDRRVSRHVITSAMYDQPALDNGPIYGHSLFTGTLIEALQTGKPDTDRRGFITGSELALHVQKQVLQYARERDSEQTPDYGSFEYHQRGEMVIALRGETHNKTLAKELHETGQHGEALGRFTGDRQHFAFAAAHYRQAVQTAGLAKMAYPEAELGLGRALLAAGDHSGAVEALSGLVEAGGPDLPPQAQFYLGIGYAGQKAYSQAAKNLRAWADLHPDEENAAWVREYVEWLEQIAEGTIGRRLALLVGIDHYSLEGAPQLRGCVNDVDKLMKPALTRWCGFPEEDILTLIDQDATCERVRSELEKLARSAAPGDSVLIHFSGHSVPAGSPGYFGDNRANTYLILHDTQNEAGSLSNGISAVELHKLVQAIPAGNTTLILDTHPSRKLIELASTEGRYDMILASDTAEVAYELEIDLEGVNVTCGMLTGALYQSLEKVADSASMTYADWFTPAVSIAYEASQNFTQPLNPLFIGSLDRRPFGREDPYLTAFEFFQRGRWPERSADQLQRQYRLFNHQIAAPFPQAHYAFGLAFLARRSFQMAIDALQRALDQSPKGSPEIRIALSRAQAGSGDFHAARTTLEKALPILSAERKHEFEGLIKLLGPLEHFRRKAAILLPTLWTDKSKKTEGADGRGSTEELDEKLQLLKNLLRKQYRISPDDIAVIGKPEATRDTIFSQLERIASGPGLIFILSDASGAQKTESLQLGSGQQDGQISLRELEKYAQQTDGVFIWVQVDSFISR